MPTTLCALSGKTNSIVSPKNVPLPTEVSPTMKPPTMPDRDRGEAVAPYHVEAVVVADLPFLTKLFSTSPTAAEEQRPAEDVAHHLGGAVPVPMQ